jgi:hypothetical protein
VFESRNNWIASLCVLVVFTKKARSFHNEGQIKIERIEQLALRGAQMS